MAQTDGKELGRHIASSRRRAQLSQKDLAALAGVHLRTLQNWEAGSTTPPRETIERLAEVLSETWDQVPPDLTWDTSAGLAWFELKHTSELARRGTWDDDGDLSRIEIALMQATRIQRDLDIVRRDVDFMRLQIRQVVKGLTAEVRERQQVNERQQQLFPEPPTPEE